MTTTMTILSVSGFIVAGLELWWIWLLLARHRRERLAQPLNQKDFQKELDRILCQREALTQDKKEAA